MQKPADTHSPVHDLIRNRWSPRAFGDEPVDETTLLSLLEAARWAPSSYNEQPWFFLVAPREDADEFARMLGCLVPANQSWARHAAVLMISVARLRFRRNDKPNRHAFHDVGLAAANLTLQAEACGLRVHQMAGIDVEECRARYAIPEGHEAVAGIAIGFPGSADRLPDELRQREAAPRERRTVREFSFRGGWGKPLA